MHKNFSILAILSSVLFNPTVSASTFVEKSIGQLAKTSSQVVIGQVVDQYSTMDPSGMIITVSTVQVDATSPDGEADIVVVHQLGGQVGDTVQTAHGISLLREEDEVLLLLNDVSDLPLLHKATNQISGLSQGFFRLHTNSAGDKIAVPTALGSEASFYSNGQFKSQADPSQSSLSLDSLMETIAAARERGDK